MNWDTVKGDWKQFSGKVKAQWGKLTDDELAKIWGLLPNAIFRVPISQLRPSGVRGEAARRLSFAATAS